MYIRRREFLKQLGAFGAAISAGPFAASSPKLFFEISLAEWSLHRTLFEKKITNLDFPQIAKRDYGISVVEYVNVFFKDKAKDTSYLNELLKRCNDNGVKNHLIMVDDEGGLGDPDNTKRLKAVENHYKWINAAKHLGCATIRVNAFGIGSREEVMKAAIDGLGRLGEYGAKSGINVVVENHGNYSSDGSWISSIMIQVNMKNVGTLPDFGNFCVKREGGDPWTGKCLEEYESLQRAGRNDALRKRRQRKVL